MCCFRYFVILLFIIYCVDSSSNASRSNDLAANFNETLAKSFASLSSITYCVDKSSVLDWTCPPCKESNTPIVKSMVRIVDADDVRVVVAKLQEQNGCLIAVRGSENIQNWIDDFEAWEVSPSAFNETCEGGCKVHGGYVVFSFLYIFRLITLND